MKRMNQRQKIIIILMIIFMILTDILICFDNSIIQTIGYLCLFIVVGLAIYYFIVGKRDNKLKQEQEVKKIIEEVKTKKKVSK